MSNLWQYLNEHIKFYDLSKGPMKVNCDYFIKRVFNEVGENNIAPEVKLYAINFYKLRSTVLSEDKKKLVSQVLKNVSKIYLVKQKENMKMIFDLFFTSINFSDDTYWATSQKWYSKYDYNTQSVAKLMFKSKHYMYNTSKAMFNVGSNKIKLFRQENPAMDCADRVNKSSCHFAKGILKSSFGCVNMGEPVVNDVDHNLSRHISMQADDQFLKLEQQLRTATDETDLLQREIQDLEEDCTLERKYEAHLAEVEKSSSEALQALAERDAELFAATALITTLQMRLAVVNTGASEETAELLAVMRETVLDLQNRVESQQFELAAREVELKESGEELARCTVALGIERDSDVLNYDRKNHDDVKKWESLNQLPAYSNTVSCCDLRLLLARQESELLTLRSKLHIASTHLTQANERVLALEQHLRRVTDDADMLQREIQDLEEDCTLERKYEAHLAAVEKSSSEALQSLAERDAKLRLAEDHIASLQTQLRIATSGALEETSCLQNLAAARETVLDLQNRVESQQFELAAREVELKESGEELTRCHDLLRRVEQEKELLIGCSKVQVVDAEETTCDFLVHLESVRSNILSSNKQTEKICKYGMI